MSGLCWATLRESLERRGTAPAITFLDAKLAATAYDGRTLLRRAMALGE